MKGMIFAVCVLACLLVGSGCMTGGYTTTDRTTGTEADSLALSKHDIIAMSRAKVGDDVIIKMMSSTNSYFRLKSRDVVELADSGVSDKVIEAMIRTADAPAAQGSSAYYAPYSTPYYPNYWWWGAYPYYYPWSFGFSVGYYYAPYYHHGYGGAHYGYGVPHYYNTSHYSGGHYSSGHYSTGHYYGGGSSGGRSISVARPSGRHR